MTKSVFYDRKRAGDFVLHSLNQEGATVRTKWLASCAALCAALLTLASCKNENIVGIDLTNYTLIGTRTDTVGRCAVTTDMYVDIDPRGNLNISENEIRELRIIQHDPKKCRKPMTFDWESHDPSVVRATRLDGTNARITGVSPGATLVCATARQNTNIVLCIVVTVSGGGGNGPNTTVTVSPSGRTVNTCSSSNRTLQMSVVTANPSGLSGTWTVSGVSGASVSQSGLLTLPENVSGTVLVVFTASNGALGSVTVVASNSGCNPPPPSPIITIAPSSLCFSMQSGQPASLPITVTATNANLADVRLVSSLTGVTLTGSGANWNVVRSGSFAERRDGNISAHLVGDPNTPLASIPVQVYTTLCPGQSSSITYSPAGGTVNGTQTLTATCVQASGQTPCVPYWTSSDPTRLRVQGTESVNIGGVTYWVGMTVTVTSVAPGSANICVYWSLTQTSPSFCSVKTAP